MTREEFEELDPYEQTVSLINDAIRITEKINFFNIEASKKEIIRLLQEAKGE